MKAMDNFNNTTCLCIIVTDKILFFPLSEAIIEQSSWPSAFRSFNIVLK